LGRLGVQLLLLERSGERIKEHNIIRHILGYASLGRLKRREMVRYIKNVNPSVRIKTRPMDVTAEKEALASLVEQWRPDLIVVCTDDEPSKHSVNEVAMRREIPLVVAGVYDAGIGGEVIVVRPRSACYGCIAAQTQRPSDLAAQGSAIDYNHLDSDELRSTAALNLDIEQIASLHSRVALNLLLGGEPDLIGVPPDVNLFIPEQRKPRALHAVRKRAMLDKEELAGRSIW